MTVQRYNSEIILTDLEISAHLRYSEMILRDLEAAHIYGISLCPLIIQGTALCLISFVNTVKGGHQ